MKVGYFASCVSILGLLALSSGPAVSQDTSAGSKVQVHLNYTGSTTVDDKHKIVVVLWNSPDFATGGNVMPTEIQSTASKNGTVTFSNTTASPVYASAALDPSGQWDGQSAPPDGSILGLYSKGGGTPEPIQLKPGKTVTIELSFDDSVKMQGGKPSK